MLDDDAAAVLADFGVPVTAAALSTTGVLEVARVEDADAHGYTRVGVAYTLRVVAGSLGTLSRNAAVTVDGVAYTLLAQEPDEGDARHEVLTLRPAAP
jgi:hypothetical protein